MCNVSKIDSSIVMIGNVRNEIFTFDSLFAQVSSRPRTSMKSRNFIFDCLFQKCIIFAIRKAITMVDQHRFP